MLGKQVGGMDQEAAQLLYTQRPCHFAVTVAGHTLWVPHHAMCWTDPGSSCLIINLADPACAPSLSHGISLFASTFERPLGTWQAVRITSKLQSLINTRVQGVPG
jgi:hypothetical protein